MKVLIVVDKSFLNDLTLLFGHLVLHMMYIVKWPISLQSLKSFLEGFCRKKYKHQFSKFVEFIKCCMEHSCQGFAGTRYRSTETVIGEFGLMYSLFSSLSSSQNIFKWFGLATSESVSFICRVHGTASG